ncbi:MAG: hypothetical protein WC365_01535 [Candidatus Babeliales bacterium]|jgi:hypothetical protein
MEVKCLGMYFNETSIDEDEEPSIDLTIKKYDLDRSSGFIIGRFKFDIESRSKLVFSVTLDGKKVDDYGTNLPYFEKSGIYDTTLFHYPNSARANKPGIHRVHVECGLIDKIVESSDRMKWYPAKAKSVADFVIRLLPNETE